MGKQMPKRDPGQFLTAVQFKDVDGDENIIEGYASTFGNEDLHGDVIEPGAFKKTVRERVPRGLVKLLDSHNHDVAHTIGTVIWAEEDERGLRFRAKLSGTPSAQEAKQKMLEGHINRLSIGYDVVRDRWEKGQKGHPVRHLLEVKLFEISAVPLAANEEARLLAVKALGEIRDALTQPRPTKAGRRNSSEDLSHILGALRELLTVLTDEERQEALSLLSAGPDEDERPPTDSETDKSRTSAPNPGDPPAERSQAALTGRKQRARLLALEMELSKTIHTTRSGRRSFQ